MGLAGTDPADRQNTVERSRCRCGIDADSEFRMPQQSTVTGIRVGVNLNGTGVWSLRDVFAGGRRATPLTEPAPYRFCATANRGRLAQTAHDAVLTHRPPMATAWPAHAAGYGSRASACGRARPGIATSRATALEGDSFPQSTGELLSAITRDGDSRAARLLRTLGVPTPLDRLKL